MKINYDHTIDPNKADGPSRALAVILNGNIPISILDVGCGTGRWLHSAIELGVGDVYGIDGILVDSKALHISKDRVQQCDLTHSFNLGRRFDLAMCLEVAEHLPESSAADLVASLSRHSDKILFGAACPGQSGQHHVNCQWPAYWQALFNSNGFVCDDSVRWKVWDINVIEPWYRQNIFWANRDPENAGREPRIKSVVHPELAEAMKNEAARNSADRTVENIEGGAMPLSWYPATTLHAGARKVINRLARQKRQ